MARIDEKMHVLASFIPLPEKYESFYIISDISLPKNTRESQNRNSKGDFYENRGTDLYLALGPK